MFDRNIANWGGDTYPAYDGYLNTAVMPAAPAAATPSSAVPASPAEGGTGGSPTPTTGQDENLRVLRESHNLAQKYSKLGDLDTVTSHVSRMTGYFTEANNIGKALGYVADDIKKAFEADPVATLAVLRGEYQKAQKAVPTGKDGAPDVAALVDKRVREALGPIQTKFQEQEAQKVTAFIDGEVSSMIKADFDGYPAEVTNLIDDAATILLKNLAADDTTGAIRKGLYEGKSANIKAAYAEAKEICTKAFNAWMTHTMKIKPGGTAAATTGAENGKFSLDDIIAGNDKATKHIASLRR